MQAVLTQHDRVGRSTDIPAFFGDERRDTVTPHQLIIRIEGAAKIAHWDEAEADVAKGPRKCDELYMCLRQAALSWFDSLKDLGVDCEDWTQLKAEFLKAYALKFSARTLCTSSQDLKQKSEVSDAFSDAYRVKPNEVMTFTGANAERGAATVEVANSLVQMGVQKMQLLMMGIIFLGGLKDNIGFRVLENGPDNIETALKLAREVEIILGDATRKPKGVTITSLQDWNDIESEEREESSGLGTNYRDSRKFTLTCYYGAIPGHVARDCYKKARDMKRGEGQRSTKPRSVKSIQNDQIRGEPDGAESRHRDPDPGGGSRVNTICSLHSGMSQVKLTSDASHAPGEHQMILEKCNEEEPELVANNDVGRENELEDCDQNGDEGDPPLILNAEEAPQILAQAGIQLADYGYFYEMEFNTVSLTSDDNQVDSEWELETTSSEEEEYNDPTPSMKAYAMKHWGHPRLSDKDQSLKSDQEEDWTTRIQSIYSEYGGCFCDSDQEEDFNPQVTASPQMECQTTAARSGNCPRNLVHVLFLLGLLTIILGLMVKPVSTQVSTHVNVTFESIEEMAGATSYLHVLVTISLSSITKQFELYVEKLKARSTDPHRSAAIINQQFAKNLNMSVNGYLENRRKKEAIKIISKHPNPTPESPLTAVKHINNLDAKPRTRSQTKRKEKYRNQGEGTVTLTRKKRLAGLTALPIAVAASAMGIYNTAQIKYLKGQLTEIKENTGRLFTVVDNHENAIQDLKAGMNLLTTYMIQLFEQNPSLLDARFSRIENQMRDRILQSTHALQAAQHRRLAVDLLSPNQVTTMFEKLNARALEFNCELLVKFPSDLLQLEVSTLFDGEDAHLLLHVPMMPKESVLRLFRLHPFPLLLYEGHFLIPDVKNDVLAVSSTDQRLHMQLSSIDLMGCHRMNQLFLCDQFGVLSQKFNKTCLGSLYMQDFKSAQEICEFNIEPVSEKVYALRKNRFLVYLPRAMTVPVKCVNGTKTEKHLGAGSQTFTLSSGCEAQFAKDLELSDLNIKMPAKVLHFTWNWVPADLFDAPTEQVAPDLQKLAQLGMSRPKLKDLQYQISASSSGYWISWHNIPLYVLTGITTTLVIIVTYLGCKKPNTGGNTETGIFTNMLALMKLQQHHASRNINVQYDNASHMDDEQRLHYEGASRYPDIATRPDQLLSRLQGIQTEMEVLKERNKTLEDTSRSATYLSVPSVQNPRMF